MSAAATAAIEHEQSGPRLSSTQANVDLRGERQSSLQLANSVIQSRRHAQQSAQLPAPVLELIQTFLDDLDQDTMPAQDAATVLTALKLCASQSTQMHASVIDRVSDLLDSIKSSLPLRVATTQCLLSYVSTAPATILERRANRLTALFCKHVPPPATARLLGPVQTRNMHLASTLFRLQGAMVARISTLTPQMVAEIVTCLRPWLFEGRLSGAPSSQNAFVPERDRAKTHVVSGVMGAFVAPVKAMNGPSRQPAGRSLAKLVQTRIDALGCLQAVALNNHQLLYAHWADFFVDSPFQRYRPSLVGLVERDPDCAINLKACHVLQTMLRDSTKYLGIAEDRPTKASFTSLSTRIGEILKELHASLTGLLTSPGLVQQPELATAVLGIVRLVVSQTPYARLQLLAPVELYNAMLAVWRVAASQQVKDGTADVLAALIHNLVSVQSCVQKINVHEVVKMAEAIVADSRQSAAAQSAAWTILSACMPHSDSVQHHVNELVNLAATTFGSASVVVRQSRTAFILALLQCKVSTDADEVEATTLSGIDSIINEAITRAQSSSERVIACQCLAVPVPRQNQSSRAKWCFDLLVPTCSHEDADVRSAACRALGMVVKWPEAKLGQELEVVTSLLSDKCADDIEPVKAVASWALANCSDRLTNGDPVASELVTTAHSLVCNSSNERIQTSGVRIAGNVLRVSTASAALALDSRQVDLLVEAICTGLVSSSAKVRWNAAHSTVHGLTQTSTLSDRPAPKSILLEARHLEQIVSSLAKNLPCNDLSSSSSSPPAATTRNKPNYKVQLQTTRALKVIKRLVNESTLADKFQGLHNATEFVKNIDRLLDETRTVLEQLLGQGGVERGTTNLPAAQEEHVQRLFQEVSAPSSHQSRNKVSFGRFVLQHLTSFVHGQSFRDTEQLSL
ncbi:hypothetical protein ACM66B_003622 [Microbotryomycetes sp. NB124-2]